MLFNYSTNEMMCVLMIEHSFKIPRKIELRDRNTLAENKGNEFLVTRKYQTHT